MKSKLLVMVGLIAISATAERIKWDVSALNKPPRTFEVTIPCADECGKVEGTHPIFIEGEPWKGRPTRVFAWWGLPAGASATNKVPAMVLIHGGGGTAFADWVHTWNLRGYAAIALDTCGSIPQGEWDGRPHPRHDWSGPSGWHTSIEQIDLPPKDQWTYHAVAAVMRCNSFLRSLPEVDPDRIGVTGISWGGYLTSIVGSIDNRFRFAAPVYGCGFYGLNPVWCENMGKDPKKFKRWLELWDPSVYLPSAKIPYLWCCGTNDEWYPLDMVRKSYELLGKENSLNLALRLRMPHAHPPEGDPPEITALANSLLKNGKPLIDVRAQVEGDTLKATFDSHGRAAVRAELLSTVSTNKLLKLREWTVTPVADFSASGKLSVKIPPHAQMFVVNVIDSEGLISSSRLFE